MFPLPADRAQDTALLTKSRGRNDANHYEAESKQKKSLLHECSGKTTGTTLTLNTTKKFAVWPD